MKVGTNDRFWSGFLVGAVLTLIFCTPESDAGHFRRVCPQHVDQGYRAKVHYVRCEERRIDPPGTAVDALRRARCESGMRRQATNYPYVGFYQHHEDYWPKRFRSFALPRREYPGDGHLSGSVWGLRDQVIVTFRYARAFGWGAWACD
ncbi:MAG: hypothetical protein ACRDIX_07285 [Actinomycetota bacterium]